MADTKFVEPGLPTRIWNRLVMLAGRAGISFAGSRTLTVKGRKSGEPRETPVNPLEIADVSYLVAPRGTTQWVRNLRAAGEGELKHRSRARRFTAQEIESDDDKLPILEAYLDKWAWEVGAFFDLPKNPTREQIAGIAHLHPVFRIAYA